MFVYLGMLSMLTQFLLSVHMPIVQSLKISPDKT